MNNKTAERINELMDATLSSIFDPNPIVFKQENETGVLPLRKALNNSAKQGDTQKLPCSLVRNAFLCGCLDFTEDEPVEHLIVGYGTKRGKGTDVHAVRHLIGSENRVDIPKTVVDEIAVNSTRDPHSEIIIFHNHPGNWLNSIFDSIPLASTADRMVLLCQKYLEPSQFLRSLFGIGGLRYYLGENGFVREIKMPSVIKIMQMLTHSAK